MWLFLLFFRSVPVLVLLFAVVAVAVASAVAVVVRLSASSNSRVEEYPSNTNTTKPCTYTGHSIPGKKQGNKHSRLTFTGT